MIRGGNNKFIVDGNAPVGKFIFSRYIRPVCLPCVKGGPLSPVDLLKDYDKDCDAKGRLPGHELITTRTILIPELLFSGAVTGEPVLTQIAPPDTPVVVTGFGHKSDRGENVLYSPSNLQEGLLKMVDDMK